jgi:hypothetical protein
MMMKLTMEIAIIVARAVKERRTRYRAIVYSHDSSPDDLIISADLHGRGN